VIACPSPGGGGRNICGYDWGKKYVKREQKKEENVKEKQKIKGKLKLNAYKNAKLTKIRYKKVRVE
jgi:hypothetical protein